jgi:hypothetical protein
VVENSAKKGLAGPSYSGDFPGIGRNAQDFGYFEKPYQPGMAGNTWDPTSDYLPTASPVTPSSASHAGLTARLENFARTIGAQIFGKW